MKVGEVRGPLLGESGFHIMKLTDTRKKELKPLAEIKEKLREELYQAELKRQPRTGSTSCARRPTSSAG